MARAALGLSINDLSQLTGLHRNTLRSVEQNGTQIRGSTAVLLQTIFEERGVEFIPLDELEGELEGKIGVRISASGVNPSGDLFGQ